jgi:hypothetical protein
MRLEGRDTDREAGTLGIDEARANLVGTVLPRLAGIGIIALTRDSRDAEGQPLVVIEPAFWADVRDARENIATTVWQTGEHVAVASAPRSPRCSGRRGRQPSRGQRAGEDVSSSQGRE